MCARALSRRRISRRSAGRSIKPLRRFAPASLIGEPRRRKDLKCPSENIPWPATPPGSFRPASVSASSPARAATSRPHRRRAGGESLTSHPEHFVMPYISPKATAPPNIIAAVWRGQEQPAPAGQGSGLLRRRCAGSDSRRLCGDPASRARRHRALPEGRKAPHPQDRLGAYRHPDE